MNALPCITLAVPDPARASGGTPQRRIRGTIRAVDAQGLTIDSRVAGNVRLVPGASTTYAYVVPSSLAAVGAGTYIGAATKRVLGVPFAIAVVVFPQSMRGMNEGHYPWDRLRDTSLTAAGAAADKMTSAAAAPVETMARRRPMTSTHMTCATVTASREKRQPGVRLLTVAYNDEQMQILVARTTAIVAFAPDDRSILQQGAYAFVIAGRHNGALTAKFVAVGRHGLKPPM